MDLELGKSFVYTKCSYGFYYKHDNESDAQSLADFLRSMDSGKIEVIYDPRCKQWIVTQYIESVKEMSSYKG
jgi:hypothetical protein